MEKHGIVGRIIEHRHSSGLHSAQAQQALNVPMDHILKSLLFISKNGTPIGVIVPGDRKVDIKQLELMSRQKGIRMATPVEIEKITKFKLGGVPPFAFFGKMKTYVDSEVMKKDHVFGSAGTEFAGVQLSPKEFLKLGYQIVPITKKTK